MKEKKNALKPMTKRVRKILGDFDELLELHEKALVSEDFPNARKYGKELCEFLIKHQEILGLSDEWIAEMKRSRLNTDIKWAETEMLEAKAKKSKAEFEQEQQKYFQFLLEESPQGKNRTKH